MHNEMMDAVYASEYRPNLQLADCHYWSLIRHRDYHTI